jgi:hypothetical protein
MKNALTVLLSSASICGLACLVPGVAAANGADANAQKKPSATPSLGRESDRLETVWRRCRRGLSGCARRLCRAEWLYERLLWRLRGRAGRTSRPCLHLWLQPWACLRRGILRYSIARGERASGSCCRVSARARCFARSVFGLLRGDRAPIGCFRRRGC